MAEEMDMMGERPPMESQMDMAKAQESLMGSDPEIQTVLMSRINTNDTTRITSIRFSYKSSC